MPFDEERSTFDLGHGSELWTRTLLFGSNWPTLPSGSFCLKLLLNGRRALLLEDLLDPPDFFSDVRGNGALCTAEDVAAASFSRQKTASRR